MGLLRMFKEKNMSERVLPVRYKSLSFAERKVVRDARAIGGMPSRSKAVVERLEREGFVIGNPEASS